MRRRRREKGKGKRRIDLKRRRRKRKTRKSLFERGGEKKFDFGFFVHFKSLFCCF